MTFKSARIDRRSALKAAGAGLFGAFSGFLVGRAAAEMVEEIHQLKPGNFTWHPERSPTGPVAIVVSLPDQLVHVYRNGVRIAVSTCSSGRPGHETPTGVFTILQKDKNHHSSKYDDAPMPNMDRITWSGIALHAGHLPGYPASHGCVRLPLAFSALLFGITPVGTPVIIADNHADPAEVVHPGLVLGQYAESEFEKVDKALKQTPLPWETAEENPAPTSVVISSADQSATILQGAEVVIQGKAFIRNLEQPIGSNVFILTGTSTAASGMRWQAVGHEATAGKRAVAPDSNVLQRISVEQAVLDAMQPRMHPGMILLTTDLPAHPDTRTGRDFVIMAQETS